MPATEPTSDAGGEARVGSSAACVIAGTGPRSRGETPRATRGPRAGKSIMGYRVAIPRALVCPPERRPGASCAGSRGRGCSELPSPSDTSISSQGMTGRRDRPALGAGPHSTEPGKGSRDVNICVIRRCASPKHIEDARSDTICRAYRPAAGDASGAAKKGPGNVFAPWGARAAAPTSRQRRRCWG